MQSLQESVLIYVWFAQTWFILLDSDLCSSSFLSCEESSHVGTEFQTYVPRWWWQWNFRENGGCSEASIPPCLTILIMSKVKLRECEIWELLWDASHRKPSLSTVSAAP